MKVIKSREVENALSVGAPVVALESTVIAHGLPFPHNLETAVRLESVIRENGAVPATIAVFDGQFVVGLDPFQLERLATDESVRKISRRDLAIAVARRLTCATTVATTSFIANLAGVRVFSTGGIGGIHRGGLSDVSADLPELARTPILVVCSGAKIVLDLPVTREWLETYGITVLGWRCDQMPAFYSRESGLPVDQRVDDVNEVAAIVRERDELQLGSSILLTVPVPRDHAIDASELDGWLTDSLRLANENGVKGKDVTPYLLAEMGRRSGGRTLAANISLLESNAKVAAMAAVAMNDLE